MDELTLKVLAAEIGPLLDGAAVTAAYKSSPRALVLELEAPDGRRVGLTLAPGDGGAMFYEAGARKGHRPAVRASLDGAVVVAAAQWHDDRLMVFDLGAVSGRRRVVAEFFGRAGGVFVLENDVVAAALVGRRAAAGDAYRWPPDRRRVPAADLPASGVARYAVAGDPQALARDVAFMSPWAAKVILGDGDAEATARRFAAFARAAAGEDVRPVAALTDGRWRPFPCDIFDAAGGDVRRFENMNAAAAFAYRTNERADELAAARRGAGRRLLATVKRLERQRRELERRRGDYAAYDEYRRMGEALKYNMAAVRKGTLTAKLPDPYGPGDIEVELRPELSPAENVKHLFGRYKKAKRGVDAVEARLETLAGELAAVREDLEKVQAASDVEALESWLGVTTGVEKGTNGRAPRDGPGRRFLSSDGLLVVVGRGAAENDKLTFEYARPHDLWLHAQQARGSHVIVRRLDKNEAVPRRTVEEAAALAAFYSGDKHAGVVPVVVIERRHVRRAKGGAGGVTYRGGDVIFVEPRTNLKPAP